METKYLMRILLDLFLVVMIVQFISSCNDDPDPVPVIQVSYLGNAQTNGNPPTDNNNYPVGSTVTVLGNSGNLSRNLFAFNGWNTQADGSGIHYSEGQTFEAGSDNVELYAEWLALQSARGICLPELGGLPGEAGPPDWWSSDTNEINDPHWNGAMAYFHGSTQRTRIGQYQENNKKYLLLSWEIDGDLGRTDGSEDFIYVGFWDSSAQSGNMIKLIRSASTSVDNGRFPADLNATFYYRDQTTNDRWVPIPVVPPAPTWISTDAAINTQCTTLICTRWSIRLRIPIDDSPNGVHAYPVDGIPLPDSFQMWYEIHLETSGGEIKRSSWPNTASGVATVPYLILPDPSVEGQWNTVETATNVIDCPQGLGFSADKITINGGSTIAMTGNNIVNAKVINQTTENVDGNSLYASFRLSNWGPAIFESPQWSYPSSCVQLNSSSLPVAPGGELETNCIWRLSAEEQCQYQPTQFSCSPMPPPLSSEQCMYLELHNTSVNDVFLPQYSACKMVSFE